MWRENNMQLKKFFICILSIFCTCLVACEHKNKDTRFMESLNLTRITDYLYEVYYEDYDYDFITKANADKYKVKLGGCSSVRNSGFHARNYDWYYDNNVEFIVHTPAKNGRHASVGVATSIPGLTRDFVASKEFSNSYKLVPFFTVDGINDAGVAININVVPFGDKGLTTGTNPNGKDLFFVNVVRYVLDYADSVDDAIELIKNSNVYAVNTDALQEEGHFMISDKNKTAVVEFVNNKMVVVSGANIMTNFYLSTELTPHAAGLERYDILTRNYPLGTTKEGMLSLMKKVWYTQAYKRTTSPFWYSEFVKDYTYSGYGDITINSPHSDFTPIVDKAINMFNNRSRDDGKTWYTVHTSVYDLENKTLTIVPQETDELYEFSIIR